MATETAILAGGCFWGMQDLIRRYDGVVSTRVGYSGGDVPNATYRNHGDHAEAIEIVFDPSRISYRELLEFFFQIHDPTTKNRQGNDVGRSYRSAIYYTSDEQKAVAEDTIADVNASGIWPGKVVTELEPAGDFWEANRNTRIIWRSFRAAIPVISCARTGDCPAAANGARDAPKPPLPSKPFETRSATVGFQTQTSRRARLPAEDALRPVPKAHGLHTATASPSAG